MAKNTNALPDSVTRRVTLVGLADIMFDRYAGDNKTQLPIEEKLYFDPGNPRQICLPSVNIMSFLSAQNTTSVWKIIGDKSWSKLCSACLSNVDIRPHYIPFTRNGQPIYFSGFVGGVDDKAGLYIHRTVARLAKGIPNPKERPVLRLPWELSFDLTLYANDYVSETALIVAFRRGGVALGLGTYRGLFGKFKVIWEEN